MLHYEAVPPQSVMWSDYWQATDPATDPANFVGPGKIWMEADDDDVPTTVLAIWKRNIANDDWVLVTTGAGGTPPGGGDADTIDGADLTDLRLKEAPVDPKAADYTVVRDNEIIPVDTSGGPVEITLPPAASVPGVTYFIIKVAGGDDVTITPDGSDEIGGAANRVLNGLMEGTLIASDGGSQWLVLARPGSGAAPEGSAGGDLTGSFPNPTIKEDVDLQGVPTIEGVPIATTADVPTGGAPDDADYLVKTSHGGLTAERAVTDTPTVAWDWGTAGQAKATIPDDVDLGGDPTIDSQPIQKVAAVYVVSTATYTFDADDAGNYGRFTNAAGCAATVPANGSVPFPIGTELHVVATQGQVTFVADTGVTLNVAASLTLLTAEPFSVATAKKVGTDEWDVFGDMEPA